MRKRRLFDREKGPDLIPARTDDTDRARKNQEEQVLCGRERQAGRSHENRTDNQHAPTSDPTRSGRQEKRDHNVAPERQRQHQAGLRLGEPQTDQIEDQNDGERTVSEQPRKSSEEQEPPVTRYGPERNRDQMGRRLLVKDRGESYRLLTAS